MSANDMKDWPAQLKRNAAVCEIAAVLFKARGEVYGGNHELAEAPPHVRDRFLLIADDVLDSLAPAPVSLLEYAANLTRVHFGTSGRTRQQVIGEIARDADGRD